MKINQLIAVLFSAVVLIACSNRPSPVLSEKKMEAVLFDLYIAEAEITGNYISHPSDSALKRDLLNSVLEKHKITEAVLDSSLFWYSANLAKYTKINEKISDRYSRMINALKTEIETTEKLKSKPIYLPVTDEDFFLTCEDLPQNVYTFKADTIPHRYGGNFSLQFGILGITPAIRPVVTFCVQCTDTTFVKRDTISTNGLYTLAVHSSGKGAVKELYGSVYFPEIYPDMTVFIHHFSFSVSSYELKEAKLDAVSRHN